MTRFYKYILLIGFSMIFLSIIMFLLSVGMFAARGNYSQFMIKLSEISFVFWFPFLIIGILLTVLGIGIYLKKTSK
ncbi:hypothetical protein [Chryseobacterium jejuense]|uniref:Uncharacterized protein n=1 Tax=Chryseobacterium jejuense TaxID=445960 RepID=A0A2X2VS71_CHRJE|nr:hypothetical protein [Chryseobacterium jejuense]SDJ17446.1 hypothetical protein SAMN05421542_2900 [Chryseobacterium jejuense]SQB28133.1 Uncharacterised protein [Chryseobacterium jejuense]